MSEWHPIIGLEVHAEMETESKMFSACPVVDSVEAPPNSAVDPLSLGLPGTLPVINMQAMEFGMMVGLALNCEIPPINQFARKNYFYPDLPKGYQISQYDRPLAVDGYVDIELADGDTKRIGVTRAHMEEDTGKLTHVTQGSLVDYNRAGVPLLEIVSEPDIHSAEEAEAYARKLRSILRYLGVNSGDMSKGVLRFEANVSVMHQDDTEYRERTEIKNLNSIRNMVRAIENEVQRQIQLYEQGKGVKRATLGWDEGKNKIIIQRYKESADEYRYFPEPDLPIVEVSREWVEDVRGKLGELPDEKKERFIQDFAISAYDAGVLVNEKAVADYFEAVVAKGIDAKVATNWITGRLFGLLNEDGVSREDIQSTPVTSTNLAQLIQLVNKGTINQNTGVKVLSSMWKSGKDATTIVDEEGLAQVSDEGAIAAIIADVLVANEDMVTRYRNGEEKLFNALFGKTMGALQGQGNPQVIRSVLQEHLEQE